MERDKSRCICGTKVMMGNGKEGRNLSYPQKIIGRK
jgi:hypothetical protein